MFEILQIFRILYGWTCARGTFPFSLSTYQIPICSLNSLNGMEGWFSTLKKQRNTVETEDAWIGYELKCDPMIGPTLEVILVAAGDDNLVNLLENVSMNVTDLRCMPVGGVDRLSSELVIP